MIENPTDVRIGIHVTRDGDENNELFTVIDDGSDVALQCKAPGDANWHPAVMYQSTAAGDDVQRVRTLVDFCAKHSIQTPESV